MKLSVVIPTHNEETFLPNCLASVTFADEIIVIDHESTDNTVSIAKKYGAKVITSKWQGFSAAHNRGAKEAGGDWLLFVDADERVSKQLRVQIQEILAEPKFSAYQVPRLNYILGQPLTAGGWYPDLVTRLIKKSALKEWVGELHEYPLVNGQTGSLSTNLYHLTHRGMDWMLNKTRNYTYLNAEILKKHNHPKVTTKNLFGAMAREFYFRAIKKSGWKDGFLGWVEILYQTFNAFLIQVQLWQLQQPKNMEQIYYQIDKDLKHEL